MKILKRLALILFVFVLTVNAQAKTNSGNNPEDFTGLTDYLRSSMETGELIALTDYENGYNASVHQASLDYFNSHPELLNQIRSDLGGDLLSWNLKEVSHRLLYVPETRPEVSATFLQYCHSVINDLMEMTGFDNPYSSIVTPSVNQPQMAGAKGITAFIVQDLACEYVAGYQFSGAGSQKVQIRLSGRIRVNEVGSYSGYVEFLPETGGWDCVRDQHTIWQSRAENPYTVLMTPLEETLHIAVRKYTETAILAAMKTVREESMSDYNVLVDEWTAVEEAVVGGLVMALAPKIIAKWFPNLPLEWIKSDLAVKAGFEKYRYLEKGIQVVRLMGVREAIELYKKNPQTFKTFLSCDSKISSKSN